MVEKGTSPVNQTLHLISIRDCSELDLRERELLKDFVKICVGIFGIAFVLFS